MGSSVGSDLGSPEFEFPMCFSHVLRNVMCCCILCRFMWNKSLQCIFNLLSFRKCCHKCFCCCFRKSLRSRQKDNQSTKAIKQVLVDQYRALGPMS